MKKLAYLSVLLVGLLVGCDSPYTQSITITNTNSPSATFRYTVRVIDGCEYLVYPSYANCLHVTHKGNCTNVLHYKRFLEEVK